MDDNAIIGAPEGSALVGGTSAAARHVHRRGHHAHHRSVRARPQGRIRRNPALRNT